MPAPRQFSTSTIEYVTGMCKQALKAEGGKGIFYEFDTHNEALRLRQSIYSVRKALKYKRDGAHDAVYDVEVKIQRREEDGIYELYVMPQFVWLPDKPFKITATRQQKKQLSDYEQEKSITLLTFREWMKERELPESQQSGNAVVARAKAAFLAGESMHVALLSDRDREQFYLMYPEEDPKPKKAAPAVGEEIDGGYDFTNADIRFDEEDEVDSSSKK